jgi:DNA mismatch endonuclease (patch repair protein)
MTDRIARDVRSKIMSRVRSRDTSPEREVRKILFSAGFRYRLHVRSLLGSPDLVFSRYRIAVFVHGCFWHGHSCTRGKLPTTNVAFWRSKIGGNVARDRRVQRALREDGWTVVTIWACQLGNQTRGLVRLLRRRRSLERKGIRGS